ncbi:AEC family transporter [Frondihabitans sp. VKM Ac-2883]|uniref:AEC family transporter n=1 Tax=Frondihabitans sp. VKM Ac-2883 TaxID=2783823 RepID=UPI00188D1276|nr:AEC family transporter [Frondihabitans sp. VKM Ac-2883]MBF4575757.1 AEC family transporter [Frondihabitans sp. VKM Ac-2883]
MAGVLIGFAIIGAVILIGYVVGRIDLLGPQGHRVLSQLVFFVLTPCLLFTTISKADVHVLFSPILIVSTLAALTVAAISIVVLRLVLRRSVPETTMGTMAGAYVNANNIGIPVAVYVLGSATYVAPVLLFQLLILTPVVLTIMDVSTNRGSGSSRLATVTRPFRNPLLIASLLGVLVSVFDIRIPTDVLEPFALVGAAAVPVVLISFGMSLHGQKPLQAGSARVDVLVESALKVVVMPVVAWILGAFVFDFGHDELFVTVVVAGLPSAQNAFNYAQRYQTGVVVARDTVLITTIAAVPVLVVVAALLK